ncbi:MAG: hypothetical protein LBH90_01670 [Tannerella sp.]|nr:hypothetical protein [Tannerella sp.]
MKQTGYDVRDKRILIAGNSKAASGTDGKKTGWLRGFVSRNDVVHVDKSALTDYPYQINNQ